MLKRYVQREIWRKARRYLTEMNEGPSSGTGRVEELLALHLAFEGLENKM